ncbi:MAG: hypothetical protein Q8P39_03490 [Candidatus Yanofskybacteria bacterium]|nr:hypothetical protein [Candidatus Yanofskybacteria bacterium]
MARKSPKNEGKRERFKRLAQARTNRVIKSLKILGNCADKSRYEYLKEDVERVFAAVDRRLNKTKARFDLPTDKEEFKL